VEKMWPCQYSAWNL